MAGLKGIGELHPSSQRFDLGDQAPLRHLLAAAREHGLFLCTHSSEPVGHVYRGISTETPDMLWRLIQEVQDVAVVCAHW